MESFPYKVMNVLEQHQVSPPSGVSIPQTSLPLTFFDIPWLGISGSRPFQRLFFYESSHSVDHFMHSILPNLKHSLSLTLQHFYPLLGKLTWPPDATVPEILYKDGDSVPLTVAESTHDFNHLIGDHPKHAHDFDHLVPQLPPASNGQIPLLAFQITLFPNLGICVGFTFYRIVADGRLLGHFFKSWASLCRSKGDKSLIMESFPFYDRTVVKDPEELKLIYLKDLEKFKITKESFHLIMKNTPTTVPELDKVRATFVMSRVDVERLKQWVVARLQMRTQVMLPISRLSKFVLTCAYVWVCLIKARKDEEVFLEWEHFCFPVGCTTRIDPPLPTTYFGNCVINCFVDVKKKDLTGEDGIAIAAESIGKAIEKMKEGVWEVAHNFLKKYLTIGQERCLSIAAATRFGVYDTDFGWGTPKKTEVTSIDTRGTLGKFSLNEIKSGEEGYEVGLVLNKLEMDAFASLFADTLKILY